MKYIIHTLFMVYMISFYILDEFSHTKLHATIDIIYWQDRHDIFCMVLIYGMCVRFHHKLTSFFLHIASLAWRHIALDICVFINYMFQDSKIIFFNYGILPHVPWRLGAKYLAFFLNCPEDLMEVIIVFKKS